MNQPVVPHNLHSNPADRKKTEYLFGLLGILLHPIFLQILYTDVRELIIIGGWRAGKSTLLAAIIFSRMFRYYMKQQPGLFWLVAANYNLARQEFIYIRNWARIMGMIDGVVIEPQQGSWVLNCRYGITLQTISAEHEETIASVAPDMIGVPEAGQCSDITRMFLQGRALEKDAMIVYAGTLENDADHIQWAWYQELATQWLDGQVCEGVRVGEFEHDCSIEHQAYSLPSWVNLSVFPDGEADEKIQRRKQNLYVSTGSNWAFDRYIAAIPNGIETAIYQPYANQNCLRAMSQEEILQPVLFSAGGLDYGTEHPSALSVGQLLPDPRDADPKFVGPKGILWIQECSWARNGGDTFWLDAERKRLATAYRAWTWNVDPNERYLAKNYKGEATSYSTSAREARVGLLRSRFIYDKIRFNIKGPGVEEAFNEIMRVHRKKSNTGQLVYVRDKDDRAASVEDLVEAIDGKPRIQAPKAGNISFGKPPAPASRFRPQQPKREFTRIR